MLTELHVADLGIVADLTLVLGRGLTAGVAADPLPRLPEGR